MRCEASVAWVAVLFWAAAILGCNEARELDEPPVVFADVDPILQEHCIECHGGPEAEADYRVEDYLTTIRCIPDPEGQPATIPVDEAVPQTAPILAVLDEENHAELLDPQQTGALTQWVADGAVPAPRSTHPGQWSDPRAEDWHGNYLRGTNWQPIVDATRSDACGLCHPGSPAPVEGVINFPPDATDCTDCHDMPGGVMACGTCHGDQDRPYPPRDQCYFPGPPAGYAHQSHDEPSPNNWSGLGCEACHFGIDFSMLDGDGLHANGEVDVVFQPAWGPDATYDPGTLACATTCHTRGGTTPVVAWDEGALDLQCNACHQTPPPGHSTIACNACHRGINAAGTALTPEALHINGRVDAF
jgi:predicted CxxxxCH...CXXCH cytochrome family protein